MVKVNVKVNGVYVGTTYMTTDEIRKAECEGFTINIESEV